MRYTTWILVAALLGGAILLTGCKSETPPPSKSPTATRPAATQPAISQKTCPVMGGDIDPKVFVDYQGRRVYFCCPDCIEKFKADPAKYLAKLK